MLQQLLRYKNIERHIWLVLLAEFFLQLINAAFLLILNLFMQTCGYEDYEIADYTSYRYLAIVVLSFPLGFYIKGQKLKPLFQFAAWVMPASSIAIIYATAWHQNALLYTSFAIWGIAYTCQQVTILPYILRNASIETQSEAISLKFGAWSIGTIISGLLIYFLQKLDRIVFNDMNLLLALSALGFIAVYCIQKVSFIERTSAVTENKLINFKQNINWKKVFIAITPGILIAIGAGLAIPFMNLFFNSVHGLSSDTFSMLGAISAILVSFAFFIVPNIKRKRGYTVAVTLTQSVAVLALYTMAITDWYSTYPYAAAVAVIAFLIRQPFMNMASPMASELSMEYAGPENREIVSALTSAFWSGSWFISARVFKLLREQGIGYGYVLLTTAVIYTIGTIAYQLLINANKKAPNY